MQWVYGRVARADCSHIICTVCLGVTALITLDNYVCTFCWRVPKYVYTSWQHNPGEIRLHLEGQEVVNHSSLAHHYQSRFRELWRRAAPVISEVKFIEAERKWQEEKRDLVRAEGAGFDYVPGVQSDGSRERRALQ